MAKIWIEFQDKLIDLYSMRLVEKDYDWNEKEECMTWNIHINRNITEVPNNALNFYFKSEKLRDKKYEELISKLDDVEFIEIL